MSARKFFNRNHSVSQPVKREVLSTDSDVRKVHLQNKPGDIQVMEFPNKTTLFFALCDTLNQNSQKHGPTYRIDIGINNNSYVYAIGLKIPVLDLAVKRTQQYIEETSNGTTKYIKNDRIEILIQDVPIDEYVKMQGFAEKLFTKDFLRGYKDLKSTDVEITSAEIDKIMSKTKPTSFQLKK